MIWEESSRWLKRKTMATKKTLSLSSLSSLVSKRRLEKKKDRQVTKKRKWEKSLREKTVQVVLVSFVPVFHDEVGAVSSSFGITTVISPCVWRADHHLRVRRLTVCPTSLLPLTIHEIANHIMLVMSNTITKTVSGSSYNLFYDCDSQSPKISCHSFCIILLC